MKPNSHACSCSDKSGTSPTITCESGLVLNAVLCRISDVNLIYICLFTPGLFSWGGYHSKKSITMTLLFITIAVQFVPPPLLLEGGVNRVDGAAVALEETAAVS